MSSSTRRFAFVDALRGIAATSVVLYHLYKQNLLRYARAPFPEPFHVVFANGYLGVYIFFVLSGFVIAYSTRGYRITPGFVGRFALRRSLRLDPPYWASIIAAILIAVVGNRALHGLERTAVPTAGAVVAHVFYIQGLVHVPNILGVFWTLCLEIQFYLLYVILLGVAQRAGDRRWAVFGPVLLIALIVGSGAVPLENTIGLWAWPFFFAGAITCWYVEKDVSAGVWGAVMLATCACAVHDPARTGVALATAGALAIAASSHTAAGVSRLEALSLGPVFQYLGKISYSLYLTHLLVGSKSARLAIRVLHVKHLGYPAMIAILLGCLAVSIVVAHVMYVVVERTAVKLSKRIKLAPQRS